MSVWMTVGDGSDTNRYFVDAANFTELFTSQEALQEEPVVLISETLWKLEYGGDPGVVGQTVRLSGREYVLAGVIPAGLAFPDQIQAWLPITRAVRRGRLGIAAIGRLEPGVTRDEAQAEFNSIAEYLQDWNPLSNRDRGLGLAPLASIISESVEPALKAMLAGVVLLLAISCANVASLLLVRLYRRTPELALFAALGAGRRQIFRRLLLESSLLAALGGVTGLAIAQISVPLLLRISPAALPQFMVMQVDWRVVAVTTGIMLLTLAAFAGLPLWWAVRQPSVRLLRSAGRGSTRGIRRFQSGLVIVDAALALVLLASSLVLIQNLNEVTKTHPGFVVEDLYALRVKASGTWASAHEKRVQFQAKLKEEIESLVGIESVSATHGLTLGGIQYWINLRFKARPELDGVQLAIFQLITPGFFQTLRAEVQKGRTFLPSDRKGTQQVTVVSEAFAAHFWSGVDPLGKQIKRARAEPDSPWWTVVGVVGDQRDRGLGQAIGPSLYFPQSQFERAFTAEMQLLIRTQPGIDQLARQVSQAIRRVDKQALLFELEPLAETLGETLRAERFLAVICAPLLSTRHPLIGSRSLRGDQLQYQSAATRDGSSNGSGCQDT